MPSSRSQRGQATLDYLALVGVLALLLAAAATLVGGGASGVANAILGQIRHALCIVTGGACSPGGRQPCVVAGDREARHVAATIAIVRVDGDRYVLRERLSDGTVRLTLAHRAGGGVEVGIGSRLRLRIRGRRVGAQREARGGAEGVLGYGEVHLARDDREADEILRALGGRGALPGGGGPQPREVFVEGGARALGRLGIGGQAAGLSLEGIGDAVLGARRDERSGNVTISFNAGGAGWGLLSAVMAGPSGSLDRQAGFGLTLDRRRRPIELSLSASGTLAAGSILPTGFAGLLGAGRGDDAAVHLRGRRWELTARADLRDPVVAAAWTAFRDDPSDPGALRALAALLRTRAQMDVRSYAVSNESDGAAAGLAYGLRFGGELDHTTDHSRLLSASTRPPGGPWERRWDCVTV